MIWHQKDKQEFYLWILRILKSDRAEHLDRDEDICLLFGSVQPIYLITLIELKPSSNLFHKTSLSSFQNSGRIRFPYEAHCCCVARVSDAFSAIKI